MALVNGDMIVPANVVATASNLLNIPDGTVGVLFGCFAAPSSTEVLYNNGISKAAPDESLLRKCAPGTNGANVGRRVRITNSGLGYNSDFVGMIVASISIETTATGGTGAMVEFYLIESDSDLYFMLTTTPLTFLD